MFSALISRPLSEIAEGGTVIRVLCVIWQPFVMRPASQHHGPIH
jgi:hypothetical protein